MDWAIKKMFSPKQRKELGSKLRADRREMGQDIKRLFDWSWGKLMVWNNPSTRTNTDSDDITRHPKIAIQLMNFAKEDRDARELVLREGYFQVE